MEITINCMSEYKHTKKKNFVDIGTLPYKNILYDGETYMHINLNDYAAINIECDGYDGMHETCIQNGDNKYIILDAKNYNICIQADNFNDIHIIYHYYGYKWGPGCSYDNAHLWEVIYIDNKSFEAEKETDNLDINEICRDK
jgi:hypothetical protein